MLRYRLLALDVDGTLVNSQNELTKRTQAALLEAQAAGIQLVLATGRRYSRVLPLVEPLRMEVPLVTASGALIKHPAGHRTLFCAQFEPSALGQMLSIVGRAGYDAILYADTFHHGFDYYCPRIVVEPGHLAEFLQLNAGLERVVPELMTSPPNGVFAGFAMGSQRQMLALRDELQERLAERLDAHVLRSPRYSGYMCEIAPFGISKWSGVRRLADQWGIPAEAICAVGDDVNDIPMIRSAGLGIAMDNALDEVKAAADRIAPAHDQDGLVRVVEWLLSERD